MNLKCPTCGVTLAIFILWSRLGTPVTVGDKTYGSGTEREFFLMLQALQETKGERPDILFYRRDDDEGFQKTLATQSASKITESVAQAEAAKVFIRQHGLEGIKRMLRRLSFGARNAVAEFAKNSDRSRAADRNFWQIPLHGNSGKQVAFR